MSNITIVSDGTSLGTKVMVNDQFIKGISRIQFNDIKPNGFVTATLTIDKLALQMALNDVNIVCDDLDLKTKIEDALKAKERAHLSMLKGMGCINEKEYQAFLLNI